MRLCELKFGGFLDRDDALRVFDCPGERKIDHLLVTFQTCDPFLATDASDKKNTAISEARDHSSIRGPKPKGLTNCRRLKP
jgi:hypothetical protein